MRRDILLAIVLYALLCAGANWVIGCGGEYSGDAYTPPAPPESGCSADPPPKREDPCVDPYFAKHHDYRCRGRK